MTSYNRRKILKASAAFAGASALGFPAISYGQADKVKIGHLTPLTGFLGALGAFAGAMTIGVVSELSTLVMPPNYRIGIPLAAIALILVFRPQGLFGQPYIRK